MMFDAVRRARDGWDSMSLTLRNVRSLMRRALRALTRALDEQTIRRELEFDADVFGAHIAHRAGYDLGVSAEYFESLAEQYALRGADDHPTFSDRAKLLRCFEPHDTQSHETLREALRNIQERKQAP